MEFYSEPFDEQSLPRLKRDAGILAEDERSLNMLEYARQVQNEAENFVSSSLSVEVTLSRALVATSAWFSLALHANRDQKRFFPPDWLEPYREANPDVIMSCILCQFANYGYSVVELVRRGLDTPARALLRSTADLSYMLAILATDRETFREYVLDKTSSPKEDWYKLFTKRKIAARFTKIDARMGLSMDFTNEMRRFQEENSEFFSEAVHHSPAAMLVGAMPRIPGTDRVELGLLGGIPSASTSTLRYLTSALNYGLAMFITSEELRDEFTPSFSRPDFWKTGMGLFQEVQPLFLTWIGEKNNKN